jgi:hypothetical protein
MAEYKIILDSLSGFGVEVTSANQHQFVRVFPTETDAQIWIAEHEAAAETTIPETELSTPGRTCAIGYISSESRATFGPLKHSWLKTTFVLME